MEAKAHLKYVRISPRKVSIVLDLIRGKDTEAFTFSGSSKMRCCMKSAPPMIAQFTAIRGKKIPSEA